MDFRLTEEQAKFRDEVRDSLDTKVPREKENIYGEESAEQHQLSSSILKKLMEKGWLALGWPKEYGGAGSNQIEQAIFAEEAGHRQAPRIGGTDLNLVAPCFMMFGTSSRSEGWECPR